MVRRRFRIWPNAPPNLACLRSASPTMQHAWRLRDVHQLRANGVKPIIGIEAYVTPETARQDKSRVHWGTEAQRRDDVSGGGLITHLTMWAENDEGLVNLIKASSVANLEGRVMRYPRMDKEVLATYSKGVIASSGCPRASSRPVCASVNSMRPCAPPANSRTSSAKTTSSSTYGSRSAHRNSGDR